MSVLAPGFLVAAPPLGDPNFDRSVVLLAAHGEEGAFGWVINGKEVMSFAELLRRVELVAPPSLSEVSGPVRVGGPVAQEQVWLVYSRDERLASLEGQFEIGDSVRASASRKVLEAIAGGVVPTHVVALLGYAGWAPDQLENEIRLGAWLPTDFEATLIFEAPRDELWKLAYQRAGTTPIAFTSRTVGSA
jgi:putative transcriptional regulator